MKCFSRQMDFQPREAGLAVLDYKKIKTPVRNKNRITLPEKGFGLYELQPNFNQFLLISEEKISGWGDNQEAWFGGTDEQPFLVTLEMAMWKDIWAKGEFFQEITPYEIGKYIKAFGQTNMKRQGDIFAYRLPFQKKEELAAIFPKIHNADSWWKAKESWKDGYPLFNTRHLLVTGEMNVHGDRYDNLIVKGTIVAPDHKNLVLDGYHILCQTARLHNPSSAD